MSKWIFVDVEATGPCPGMGGVMTEFGAVNYQTRDTFHGVLYESEPDPANPAKSRLIMTKSYPCACMICSGYCGCGIPGHHDKTYELIDHKKVFSDFKKWLFKDSKDRPSFISDNVAYDWQWINYYFWTTVGENPFGHSGRRISDFYAGLQRDFRDTQSWKRFRVTPHDHNPVHDAMGNVEAFEKILENTKLT